MTIIETIETTEHEKLEKQREQQRELDALIGAASQWDNADFKRAAQLVQQLNHDPYEYDRRRESVLQHHAERRKVSEREAMWTQRAAEQAKRCHRRDTLALTSPPALTCAVEATFARCIMDPRRSPELFLSAPWPIAKNYLIARGWTDAPLGWMRNGAAIRGGDNDIIYRQVREDLLPLTAAVAQFRSTGEPLPVPDPLDDAMLDLLSAEIEKLPPIDSDVETKLRIVHLGFVLYLETRAETQSLPEHGEVARLLKPVQRSLTHKFACAKAWAWSQPEPVLS